MRTFGMRSSAHLLVLGTLLLLSCDQQERRHSLSSLDLKPGHTASLDVFGRVVAGNRNQLITFKTGVVPIPLVQTLSGIVNLDDLRVRSFSEHSGRASAGYLLARSVNISRRNLESKRFDNISLTELDRSRRVRTAVAQFPALTDFKEKGYRAAMFSEQVAQLTTPKIIFYPIDSTDVKIFERALGRPLRFPVLVDASYLIENYK